MSEVKVSIQSGKKTQDESSSAALVNNISNDGGNNAVNKKEENSEKITTLKSNDAPAVATTEVRSPEPAAAGDAVLDSNSNKNEKPTPVKRTPSKRRSFVERAQRESEELVKNLGGSLDIEGGRKTRSSTRGTPLRSNAVSTPPPAKKGRGASTTTAATTGTPRRGRGRKLDITIDANDSIAENEVASPEGTNSVVEKPDEPKTEEDSEKSKDIITLKPSSAVNENIEKEEKKIEDVEMNDVAKSKSLPVKSSDSSSSNVDNVEKITSSSSSLSVTENKTTSANSTKDSTVTNVKISPIKSTVKDNNEISMENVKEDKKEEKNEIKETQKASVQDTYVTKVTESIVEPMEVDACVDNKISIVKDGDRKIEKTNKEIVNSINSSNISNSKNSNATSDTIATNTTINTITTTTTTTTITTTTTKQGAKNVNNKINETVDKIVVACDASTNKIINSIPVSVIDSSDSDSTKMSLTDNQSSKTIFSNENKNTTTTIEDVSTPPAVVVAQTTVTSETAQVKDKTLTIAPTPPQQTPAPPISVTSANVIEDKSEKSDLCEPKLSSPQPPPISTASETIVTPQYCN